MKTSDLIGAHLDYWTGRADGKPAEKLSIRRVPRTDTLICVYNNVVRYDPSTNAEKGLNIIERSRLHVIPASGPEGPDWVSFEDDWGTERIADGETPLIAACRAKVASVYGDEVPEIQVTE